MKFLLGIDAGSTVTKAVLFDAHGTEIAAASARIKVETPQPHWVERDMNSLARASLEAVKEVVAAIPAPYTSENVAAIGITGHGDGLYLVDANGHPVRPAILSLDTRAQTIVDDWHLDGTAVRASELTGQPPFAAAPSALLAWLTENEPESVHRAAAALSCKDFLKLVFTDTISTDPTEASSSFTNVRTQAYDDSALELYGLRHLRQFLAPVVGSCEIAGRITAEAALETGLTVGTPVVSGLHDVDACAVGTGSITAGELTVIAGTYSINEIISDRPVTGDGWLCRNFAVPGLWMNMAVSPTSATNLEWFIQHLSSFQHEGHDDLFAVLNAELESIASDPSDILYLPFLYGSPFGAQASSAFIGQRAWHNRAHLIRALLEGVVHTHRWHIDQLRSGFAPRRVALAGGGSRSPVWAQMFADSLQTPVEVLASRETGALGAAICAGVGAGVFANLDDGVGKAVHLQQTYTPSAEGAANMESGYGIYQQAIHALSPVWAALSLKSGE